MIWPLLEDVCCRGETKKVCVQAIVTSHEICYTTPRRDVRVVECAALEKR